MYSASLSTPWIIADEREKMSMAHQNHVTQIAVGESLRSRLREALRGSFVNESIRKASNIDIPAARCQSPGPETGGVRGVGSEGESYRGASRSYERRPPNPLASDPRC